MTETSWIPFTVTTVEQQSTNPQINISKLIIIGVCILISIAAILSHPYLSSKQTIHSLKSHLSSTSVLDDSIRKKLFRSVKDMLCCNACGFQLHDPYSKDYSKRSRA